MSKASTALKLRQVNNLLRSWGYTVDEQEGCWTRDNGLKDWTAGEPEGMLNHHFVIPLSAPIQNGVQNVTYGDSTLSGPKCNWYCHASKIVFIAMGPANHAGSGDNMVLKRALADQFYTSTGPDNYNGNSFYLGQESHHPGDMTAWPDSLVDNIVALNAAICFTFNWHPSRVLNHKWHTKRKIDMSNSFPGDIQKLTIQFMNKRLSGVPAGEEDFLMSVTEAQWNALVNVVNTLAGQVNNMYENEALPGLPYNKTAANFNDTRGVGDQVALLTGKVEQLQVSVNSIPQAQTPGDVAKAVWEYPLTSLNDGQQYSAEAFVSDTNHKVSDAPA